MPRVYEASLADVKAASGPLDRYVERYICIERRGRVHLGRCPFHAERTPSFYVYRDHYHCYGCGAHGDVFNFLSEMEKRPLGEVIADLRDRSGLANGPTPEAEARLAAHRAEAEALANEPDPYEIVMPTPANAPPLPPLSGKLSGASR